MAGNDRRQIEFALELPAGGDEVLGLFHGRQGGTQGLAVDRRVAIVVQSLGDQAQCGGELGPSGKVGPAVGQFESMADLLVGLRGDLLHRFRTHGPGHGQPGGSRRATAGRAGGIQGASRPRGATAELATSACGAEGWGCVFAAGAGCIVGANNSGPATIDGGVVSVSAGPWITAGVTVAATGDRARCVQLAAGNSGKYLGHSGLTRSHEGESASVA